MDNTIWIDTESGTWGGDARDIKFAYLSDLPEGFEEMSDSERIAWAKENGF